MTNLKKTNEIRESEVLTILSFCPFLRLAILEYVSGFLVAEKYTCSKIGAGREHTFLPFLVTFE